MRFSNALRYGMLTRDHTVLPATHTLIHKWNEPTMLAFTPQPQSFTGTHLLSRWGWKAELAWVAGLQTEVVYLPADGHPSLNPSQN